MFLKKLLKSIKISSFLILISIIPSKSISDISLKTLFKNDGKLIFIRHANAPGNGDPENFDISDCGTQRNLDYKGILDSKKIGVFFKEINIPIDKVLSSEWCRCKDTANYAFGKFEVKNFLNSFYSQKFAHNKANQIKELKEYIKKWNGKGNLIFITHYVVILETLKIPVSSGEIVVADKDFNILARKKISNN